MGHSGSGKSTLLNMLGMLDRPTSGEVFLDGQPVSQVRNLDSLRAQKIGFVFQSFYLLPVLSAMENVQVPMFEGNLPLAQRPKKAIELLELVNLGHRVNHRRCSFPWANGSAWPSRGPWPTTRCCCWPTSRPAISTRSRPIRCSTCSPSCTASAA